MHAAPALTQNTYRSYKQVQDRTKSRQYSFADKKNAEILKFVFS